MGIRPRKILAVVLFAMAMIVVPQIQAQVDTNVRYLVGSSGGDSFDNEEFGVTAGIEAPFLRHYEFDLADTFYPIESHVALGRGMANVVRGGGHAWIAKHFGFNGAAEYSNYDVTHVSKGGYDALVGPSFRFYGWGDAPVRIDLFYVRELNNGITNGVETSHLQGVAVRASVRLGCTGAVCFRVTDEFAVGHVLEQGNPVCDGTYGNGSQVGFLPCPRTGTVGGSFTASVTLEFPRQRSHESDLF